MNTSTKRDRHFLVGRQRADRLLIDWANAQTDYPTTEARPFSKAAKDYISRTDADIMRLIRRYPELFSGLPSAEPPPQEAESKVPSSHWEIIARVQQFLRLAWDAPDLRHRDWYIFKARERFHELAVFLPMWESRVLASNAKSPLDELTAAEFETRINPPAMTPFEQVMYRFHRIAGDARHCKNPECPAPYFFGKKGQKYCSSKCSAPAQREQKRRWWQENRSKGGDQ